MISSHGAKVHTVRQWKILVDRWVKFSEVLARGTSLALLQCVPPTVPTEVVFWDLKRLDAPVVFFTHVFLVNSHICAPDASISAAFHKVSFLW
jgi:hypothetical protein